VILQLRDFVTHFPRQLPREEAARRIHRFLNSTLDMMMTECVVFAADADKEGKANTAEGLEKFLLSRLHARVFATEPSDSKEDDALRRQIGQLQWVDFENLGIPAVDPSLLDLAVSELRRIDSYKAPRDKLVCILNACRVINDVLKRTLEESSASGAKTQSFSADDFLPLLIYACIKANPPRLHSNLEFVAAFRHPSRLVAEDAYFLTALQSAAAFVQDVEAKALEVTPEVFEDKCAAALDVFEEAEKEARLQAKAAAIAAAGQETAQAAPAVEATTVAEKAATIPVDLRRRLRESLDRPLKFEMVQSGRQLRIGDVAALLAEYQELARLLRKVEASELDAPMGTTAEGEAY